MPEVLICNPTYPGLERDFRDRHLWVTGPDGALPYAYPGPLPAMMDCPDHDGLGGADGPEENHMRRHDDVAI